MAFLIFEQLKSEPMKVLLIVLSFIVFYLVSQYLVDPFFAGNNTIKVLFSLTIAAVFVGVGFGMADTFMPDAADEE